MANQQPPRETVVPVPASDTNVVIGVDERVQITDTGVYPWRAIAYLEIYRAGFLWSACTGTFVGPDTLITAAHCLYDPDLGWVDNIAVVPGKNGAYEPYGFEWASNWWVPDAWIDTGGGSEFDWGVIKLPTSTLGNTVGWFTIGNLKTDTLARSDFLPAVVGYPGDQPEGTMWAGIKDAFTAVHDFTLEYDIDTAAGQSGSAIFSANVDEWFMAYVVGIHTQGSSLGNSGQRIDAELLTDVLVACTIMDCLISYFEEALATPISTSLPVAELTGTPTNTPVPIASPVPATSMPTIGISSLTTEVGEGGKVEVIALNMPSPGLGAWSIDVQYDAGIASAITCVAEQGGVCNPQFASGVVRFTGASSGGLEGDTLLASIVFECRSEGVSSLLLVIDVLADATIGNSQPATAAVSSGIAACLPAPPTPTFTNTPRPTLTPTPPTVVGDSSCDGIVNPVDAAFILQWWAGLFADLPCPGGGDADGDGDITVVDATVILQFYAGFISSLPP